MGASARADRFTVSRASDAATFDRGTVAALPRSGTSSEPPSAREPPLFIQEALRFGHDYIGCEHLLLGILADEDGAAAKVLANHGVTREVARRWVREAVGSAEPRGTSNGMSFTPRATVVLRLADIEAERLGEQCPRAAHLLLAILTEGEGLPNHLFDALNVDVVRLRQDLLEVLEVPADLRAAYLRQRIAAEQTRRAPDATRR